MTGTFTAGAVLTAANLNTAINSLTLNAQSGAGYTLVLADAGKLVTVSNASAQNLTIPLNSSVAYATGTVIEVLNIGAGTWTLTPTGGVTLTGPTSVPTSARVRLTKTGTDAWYANNLGGGGLTLITTSTFSASAAVNVNNCFSSTYENYRIVVAPLVSSAAGPWLQMRLRASAADNTTSNYSYQSITASSTTVTASRATAQTLWQIGTVSSANTIVGVELSSPFSANLTLGTNLQAESSTVAWRSNGFHFNATTSFDGFTLYPDTGTITGTLRVYGYANS